MNCITVHMLFNTAKEAIDMKRTFQPNRRKQKKTSGFLVRMSSASGKNVIKRRRAKGRKAFSVS